MKYKKSYDTKLFTIHIRKNVEMENYLPKWGLQIHGRTFFDKIYIFYVLILNIKNQKFHFSKQNMSDTK